MEFIVIVEHESDFRIATKLVERVLIEKIDWLEEDTINNYFSWCGLKDNTNHSCWKDIKSIVGNKIRYLGHDREGKKLKADGALALKILKYINLYLLKKRDIKAVIFIRDLDSQPERREGLEQARLSANNLNITIILGTADPKREAWVLNGFIPQTSQEEKTLDNLRKQLTFDPCIESHRLREKSFNEPERIRNTKVILDILTNNNYNREAECWEMTDLDELRKRGEETGLTKYLEEIENMIKVLS
ncbi:MAG: hypothetical protein AB4041_01755 [Microcystaceae cyanobacterium]